ncbi:MAG TPA: arylamine N-acetyltransferase [Roseiflexaceae bacterium]|nr:arylamine N-acetyltransferase [Roseiflexaceae bacterium]
MSPSASPTAYLMQAQLGWEWRSLYRFDLQQELPDYGVSSWYLSNHPHSHFVTGLMAARPEKERRYALRNNQLTIHHLHGDSERRVLATIAELRAVLEDAFRNTLPIASELEPAAPHRVVPAGVIARRMTADQARTRSAAPCG